jgi:hypothetical protein
MKKYLFLLSFLLVCFSSNQPIKNGLTTLNHFLGTDMKQTQLQLMFHGQEYCKAILRSGQGNNNHPEELTDNPIYVFLYSICKRLMREKFNRPEKRKKSSTILV